MSESTFHYRDFSCQRCGACCLEEKVVRLSIIDLFRLAEHFNLSPKVFYKKYCMISDPFNRGEDALYLKTSNGCPFYKNQSCNVYALRPDVCKAYPFIYHMYEHVFYRVDAITFDSCSVSKIPYDIVLMGDETLGIEMGLADVITQNFLYKTHNRFDETIAQGYVDQFERVKNNKELREDVYHNFIKASIQRRRIKFSQKEQAFTYFLFTSGFYNLFLKDVDTYRKAGLNVIYYMPEGVGFMDNNIQIMLKDNDYKSLIKKISKKDGYNIRIKVLMTFNTDEWMSIAIPINDDVIMTFYRTTLANKEELKSKLPIGEISLTFNNMTESDIVITGKDTLNWMASTYAEKPFEYKLPDEKA